MTREEAINTLKKVKMLLRLYPKRKKQKESVSELNEAVDMAIESLKNEPILCEDCRYRNTWDNPRLDPQYYRCRMGVKFRDYGYVREDDYCPIGRRREESEADE